MPTDSQSRSSPSRRSRRTHTSAFERIPCRADYRLNSFFPRTVRDWNTALPPETPGLSPLVHWRLHLSRGRYRGCSTVSMVLFAVIPSVTLASRQTSWPRCQNAALQFKLKKTSRLSAAKVWGKAVRRSAILSVAIFLFVVHIAHTISFPAMVVIF